MNDVWIDIGQKFEAMANMGCKPYVKCRKQMRQISKAPCKKSEIKEELHGRNNQMQKDWA